MVLLCFASSKSFLCLSFIYFHRDPFTVLRPFSLFAQRELRSPSALSPPPCLEAAPVIVASPSLTRTVTQNFLPRSRLLTASFYLFNSPLWQQCCTAYGWRGREETQSVRGRAVGRLRAPGHGAGACRAVGKAQGPALQRLAPHRILQLHTYTPHHTDGLYSPSILVRCSQKGWSSCWWDLWDQPSCPFFPVFSDHFILDFSDTRN